jgi:dTDP-4-dehydrorhamnose 3,5-epimerase
MKLGKPIVFKNIFNVFEDNRGFLSALDIDKLIEKIPNSSFNFEYQLLSFSEKKHTFRGMHYQEQPFTQNKLIVVHQGSIADLVIELGNKDVDKVLSFEMSAGDAIFVPNNYAHGFVSLTDNVLMQYFMDNKFSQENYKGFNITKYLDKEYSNIDLIISEQDRNLIGY